MRRCHKIERGNMSEKWKVVKIRYQNNGWVKVEDLNGNVFYGVFDTADNPIIAVITREHIKHACLMDYSECDDTIIDDLYNQLVQNGGAWVLEFFYEEVKSALERGLRDGRYRYDEQDDKLCILEEQ